MDQQDPLLQQDPTPEQDPTLSQDPPQPDPSPDANLIDLQIGNQTYKVPIDELKSGYLRQQDYTRKTMQLAEMRRAVDQFVSERQRDLEEYGKWKQDPRIQGALNPPSDPNAPVTLPATKQLVESQVSAAQQQFEHRLQQGLAELELRQLAATYTNEIDTTIKSAIGKHEILREIPGIDTLLKADVAAKQPATLEDAKKLLIEAASSRAGRLLGRLEAQKKQDAIASASRLRGIESPGGAPPAAGTPQGDTRLGSTELRSQVMADLEGLFRKD